MNTFEIVTVLLGAGALVLQAISLLQERKKR